MIINWNFIDCQIEINNICLLQKRRGGERSNPKYSVTSTNALVESTTTELGYSKISSGIGGISEVSDRRARTISIESVNSITNDLNGTPYIGHVIDEKLVDIDNNNEKRIDHAEQQGLYNSIKQKLVVKNRTSLMP